MSKRFQPFRVLGSVLFIAGLGFAVLKNMDSLVALQSLGWPTVPGRVIKSAGMRRSAATVPNAGASRSAADLLYTYSVKGRAYFSSKLSFDETLLSAKALAGRGTETYRPGDTVTVSYDPYRPEVAVLQPGRSRVNYGVLIGGFLLAGFGAALFSAGSKDVS